MEITELAQFWVGRFLREGDLVIDATVGNGHDTLFLAKRVGETGRVIGFDVQESALNVARRRLEEAGVAERMTLIHGSHVAMRRALNENGAGGRVPRAILFNLGYLPGGDKQLTTRAEETVPALEEALSLLEPGGILGVVVYPGHPEGDREARAVVAWSERLSAVYEATLSKMVNRSAAAPFLLTVEPR